MARLFLTFITHGINEMEPRANDKPLVQDSPDPPGPGYAEK